MILILNYTIRIHKLNVNVFLEITTIWNFIDMFLYLSDSVSLFQNFSLISIVTSSKETPSSHL